MAVEAAVRYERSVWGRGLRRLCEALPPLGVAAALAFASGCVRALPDDVHTAHEAMRLLAEDATPPPAERDG